MKGFLKFIFTIIAFAGGIFAIAFVMMVGKNYKADKNERNLSIESAISDIAASFSEIKEHTDVSNAKQVIDFLKDKSKDGSLETKDGIQNAIKEGALKYSVAINDETIEDISKAVESLENMGFSTEKMIDEIDKLYLKYGEEFLDHAEEAFVESAKDAAGNTAQNVWNSIEKTVLDAFQK